MHEIITIFVEAMNRAPPGVVALFMLLTAYGGVLLLMRLFGIYGLVAFVIVSILGANIQVLKVVQFAVFPHPVALGTILFASSYLAIDLVTEYYGSALARRIIWLGFELLKQITEPARGSPHKFIRLNGAACSI